jgi:hypothetical protein
MFAAKLRFVVDDSACRLYEQPIQLVGIPGGTRHGRDPHEGVVERPRRRRARGRLRLGPFGYLVRLDQPTLHGLSRHGVRTQLYTSRGTGFWGPPFRIFAPPEIAVLTRRPAPGPTGS